MHTRARVTCECCVEYVCGIYRYYMYNWIRAVAQNMRVKRVQQTPTNAHTQTQQTTTHITFIQFVVRLLHDINNDNVQRTRP